MFKKYSDKEIECPKCHQKAKPIIELNRVKSEFFGASFTGKDKAYWLKCPNCKTIIGTE